MEFLSLKRIIIKIVILLLFVEVCNTYYIYTQLRHIAYEQNVSLLKAAAYEAIVDRGSDDFSKLYPDIWHVYVGVKTDDSYELLKSTATAEEIASSQRPIISKNIIIKIINEQKNDYIYEYRNGFDTILSVTVLKKVGNKVFYGVAENLYENNLFFSKSFYRAFSQSIFSLGVSTLFFLIFYFWFDKLRKRVKNQLKKYKNTARKFAVRNRFLFDKNIMPIMELDKFGRIKNVNAAFYAHTGFKKADTEGKSMLEFLEAKEDIYQYVYKYTADSAKNMEAVLKSNFGEMDNRSVKITPKLLEWKNQEYRLLFLDDETEVKKLGAKLQRLNSEMDEKIRKSAKYSRTILDAEPNIIWVQERNKIIDANRAFFDIFCSSKYDLSEFTNKHSTVFELFEKIEQEGFVYAFPHKDPVAYLLTNRHRTHKAQMTIGGKRRVFKISANYLMGNEHHFLNDLFIVIMIDITDAESLKRNEINFAKTNAIGQLAAGVTHEINTPLTYIKGSFEMLKLEMNTDNVEDKAYVDELVVTIEEGMQRIENIVKTMKELNVKTTDKLEVTNLFDTIKTAINMIRVRAKYLSPIYINGALFDVNMPMRDSYKVYSQKQKLEQVWIIVLNNALDEFGTSDIKFENRRIDIQLSSDEYFATVRIKDNAGGIPEEILDKIFEPMFSTKTSSGMGLGLNITKKITAELKGGIEAYNEGRGAVFEVRIPIIK